MHNSTNNKTEKNDKQGQTNGLLDAVMASCSDAIIAYSFDGRIEAWNHGATVIYGYSHEEAIGAIGITTPPERQDERDRLAAAAREGNAIEHFETVRVRKSGECFPAAVCGFPIRNGDNVVTGYASIERDISDRVDSADALRIAFNEAQEANTTKSRFLANASHELRTPMNAIVGMTALALEEDISAELRDYMETIRDSADTMLHLVNDLLDLSKFESDRFELDEITFDPRELVEGTIKVLGSAAHAKGLELVCRVAPKTPVSLIGDPIRLRQILTNLVGNAVKFTATGEVVVSVTPVWLEKKRCQLSISVSDTGIGISEDDIQRIFAPFTQVDVATTRRYSGTGLGLTISKHLIECYNSKLIVESTIGEGSCFSFDLILPVANEPSEDKQEQEAEARLRGLSVLVVDDNLASREALADQLTAWAMAVKSCASGNEALNLLKEAATSNSPFDLAVIDALMPGIDGFSVAAHIEEDEGLNTKPILMASTTDRLEFSRRCAEAGAAAFVQKPISQSQLLGAVAQASGAATLDSEPRNGLFDQPVVQPLNILLVEDTPANRKVVHRVLSKRGHHLDFAVNGREAIDIFRNTKYDLVLMDVQMPIMDGYQATEAIREIERANNVTTPIPIIAMTAHTMWGDREQCLKVGMDNYLSKPIDLHKLIKMVENTVTHEGNSEANQKIEKQPSAQEGVPSADIDSALTRLRGDRGLMLDMIGFYNEDSPQLLEAIHEAIIIKDFPTIQRSAHSLKGLVATFDAHSMVAVARELEMAAENKEEAKFASLVSQLEVESKRLKKCLGDFQKKNS